MPSTKRKVPSTQSKTVESNKAVKAIKAESSKTTATKSSTNGAGPSESADRVKLHKRSRSGKLSVLNLLPPLVHTNGHRLLHMSPPKKEVR